MYIELSSTESSRDIDPSAALLLKLLADPTRRRIFLALMRGETCNCELRDELGLAENLVSHHLRQLRDAGFARERRDETDARWIYYRLDTERLASAWSALGTAFDPAHIGARAPQCGPAAKTCC
jgi:DNA-binding transcriptional ArsR family regulator